MATSIDESPSSDLMVEHGSTPDLRSQETPQPRSETVLAWLTKNPLMVAVVGLIAGILLDEWRAVPLMLSCVVFVAGGLSVARTHRWDGYGFIGLALAGLAVGIVLHDLAWRRWPADHVIRCCAAESINVRVRGTVVSTPMTRLDAVGYPQDAKTRFMFEADEIESDTGFVAVSGLVSVTVHEPALAMPVGERVELLGRIRSMSEPVNPGCPDFARINRRHGVLVHMSCRRADDVRIVESDSGWRAWLGRLRHRARAAMLNDTFPGDMPGSGLLAAMVLGQRSAIDPTLNDAFVRSGTLHYLSVSGAHVGMLVGVVFGAGILLGASRRQCAILAMMAATSYAILAEPSAPLIRAAILTDIGCVALLVRRPVRVANWLAASAMILLVVKPLQLFDAGFQLSFLTLISVIYWAPCLHLCGRHLTKYLLRSDDPLLSSEIQTRIGMRQRPSWWKRIISAACFCFTLGLAPWFVGTLVAGYHFQQVQIWGWFNSPVLMPIVWLVMVLGLSKASLAVLTPSVAGMLSWPLGKATESLIVVVRAMAEMPGFDMGIPRIPAWLVWFGLATSLIWIVQRPLRLSPHCVGVSGLVFVIALTWSLAPRPESESLIVHVLSVGNASANVIELPNGKNLIYDIGSSPTSDVEKWVVGPLLARDHCRRVDAVLLSHANLDHYCGLPGLLDRRVVSAVVIPPQFERDCESNHIARGLMSRLRNKPGLLHKAGQGDRLSGTGEVDVEVLWPPRSLKVTRSNDDSMVVRVSYGGRRILLCGDIEEYALRRLLATTDIRCDVLLLPHHGSVTPATEAFIQVANPEVCVRSSGRPIANSLLQPLAGRPILSTADRGAVKIVVHRGKLSVASGLTH